VDLSSGNYAPEIDPDSLLRAQASRDPLTSVPIPRELDIAVIKERSRYVVVYQVYEDDQLTMIILPVYGYGLWSTLYGYIALQADANTVVGLRFYQHGETPGLGGEIDNPRWLRLWPDKKIYDDAATPLIEVVKGQVSRNGNARETYQVDGISGATLTGRGVTNLLRYWFGEHGYGPYLQNLRDNIEETP
jgi:Na+-transporting NADH:ubiquinone oxidoreductase subunit C